MLIGLLSDAHGNPAGLRACLAALRAAGAEQLYFLGDSVGYLPGESEVLELLAGAGAHCQQGNHEAMLLGDLPLDPGRDEAYGLAGARRRMTPAERAEVAGWPRSRVLATAAGPALLVHGSPRAELTEYVYPDSDLSWFADLDYAAVFMGNTHRPFIEHAGEVLVVNVGSCGLPRDQGDLAACAVFDPVTGECEILRVPMPAAVVLDQFDRAPHPIVVECLARETADPVGRVVGNSE